MQRSIVFLVSDDTLLLSKAKQLLEEKIYSFQPIVIANRQCSVYDAAAQLGFDRFLVSEQENEKQNAEPEIKRLLDEHDPVLIVAAGYNKLFSSSFVQKYAGKLVNFHPSLLPAFAGLFDLNVQKAVLKRGCRISGTTVHLVDKGADTGKIVFQQPIAVDEFDTPESLKKKIQHIETELLPKLIGLALDGKLQRLANSSVNSLAN